MSSPSHYWDDNELNSAVLNELAAFEASQVASTSKPIIRKPSANSVPPPLIAEDSDDLFDLSFDVGAQDLQRLDAAIERDYQRKGGSASKSPSSGAFTARSLSGRQITLFGEVISPRASPSKKPSSSRGGPQQRKSPTRQVNRKVKKWDHTAFAKTGRRPKAGKGKGKENLEEEREEEVVEFEQFPAPFVPVGPLPSMKLQPDLLEAQRWLFPLNRPKRDYQFNISRHCLFENTLVALPTGLGKTFIAGVVMLNFYRWFPDGKIAFVAPTKPLVAQQIDACHKVCGIPGSYAIELTGNNPRAFRAKAWQEKRIFYMTPQTFENDLRTDNCDPRDIVLLVIDEAHKGAGEYAYAKVVRFLMAKNPYFRVLALTATPGRTPEAVQAIIDALHISRIEIRDEQSLDIRSYINEKKIEQHIVAMDEGIQKLRDLLAKVLEAYLRKCAGSGVLHGNLDPVLFHPYRANAAMEAIHRRPDARQLQWAYPLLRKIGALARAMGYLLEATPHMCFRSLTEEAESDGSEKRSGLNKDPAFQALMDELKLQKSRGFAIHPKLEKLKTLVVQHFGQRLRDDGGSNAGERSDGETRAIVFVTFREAVGEIVEFLNQESPLLKATKFIGQGIDKKGNKGLAQREQLDIINQFKGGAFNILVATSVGEEGLDIGEVDLIVCYDAQKTPVRMLQRVGRTGRKREGYVHVLLAEGREEMNWNKAREAYNDVQRSIVRGEQLEFYNDVERLLPDHVKPECLEMVMEIEEYSRPTTEKSRENAIQEPSKKRKRNNDPTRDIPPGASTGFVSVAELLVKQKVKRRKKTTKFDEHAGLDDNTDEEIEAGLFAPPRRAASTSATFAKPPKTKLKRAKTTADGSKKRRSISNRAKAPKAAGNTELTLSQLGAEDSDDMEIEKGLWNNSPPSPPKPSPAVMPSSPDIPLVQNRSIIEICTSAAPSRSPSPSNKNGYPTPSRTSGEDAASEHLSPSPPKSPVGPSGVVTPEPEQDIALDAKEPETVPEDDSLAWLLADSDDAEALASSPIAPRRRRTGSQASDAIEIEDSEPENGSPIVLTSSPVGSSGPPVLPYRDMPPPAVPLPRMRLELDAAPILVAPSPSLPVRPSGRRTKKNPLSIAQIADSSSPLQPPPPSQKRLHRRHHSPHDDSDPDLDPHSNSNSPRPPSPPKKNGRAGSGRRLKRLKVRDTAAAARLIPWIDVEAGHSGDEVSIGGGGGGASSSQSDEGEEEPENESDRRFAGDFLATQASPSYDQSAVYRRSLLSQAPVGAGGRRNDGMPLSVPVFAAPPVRRGGAPLGRIAAAPGGHERIARSSSPAPTDEEDYYMLGSFVVDDDAEISFTQSSDP